MTNIHEAVECTEQRFLSEAQNASFDADYHTPKELAAKFSVFRAHFGERQIHLLDAGGGNGSFSDAVLEAFPHWSSTIIDISDYLLSQNAPHPRKRLVKASIYDAATVLSGEKFDVVSTNWILHHLVGKKYQDSLKNITQALSICTSMLNEDGLICVGENRYQGIGDCNIPAWLIYRLTTIRNPFVTSLVRKQANTAGVGVCFQSEQAWASLFYRAGLKESYPRFHNQPFQIRGLKKWALLIKTAGKVHFYLTPIKR